MARIAGVNIPVNKQLAISLTYIYGIGISLSHSICDKLELSRKQKVNTLKEQDIILLRKKISSLCVEGDLRRLVNLNIKRKKDLRTYQGLRHIKRLPVRGQNTHSNARTRKGKAITIAGKKK